MKRGLVIGLLLTVSTLSFAVPSGERPAISKETRMELIRLMNAEYAWVKVPLPRAEKGITIRPDGKIDPTGRDMQMQIAKFGPLARPGERVQVTSIEIKDKQVLLELNGGFTKKAKWYQRIQVGASGGMTNVAPGPDNSRAKGTTLIVEFKKHVPEMTMAELKQLVSPLLDFTVKSAAQAYTESLPKNVQDAIKDHRVLVGMNKEMVTYSKGRPPQRVREKDTTGTEYEEWIYGMPPQDTEFVRFTGDEVTQLKIMKVDGEKIVKTQREVTLDLPEIARKTEPSSGEQVACDAPLPAATNPDGTPRNPQPTIKRSACTDSGPALPAAGSKRPTLRRPSEATPEDHDGPGIRPMTIPPATSGKPAGVPDTPNGTPDDQPKH
jgi:hypothetical protein